MHGVAMWCLQALLIGVATMTNKKVLFVTLMVCVPQYEAY